MAQRLIFLAAAFLCAAALAPEARSETVPFDSGRWEIKAKEGRVVNHLGRNSLYLKAGVAAVRDTKFKNGVIEFDIAFTGERGFMGAVWRLQDFENYEEFYLRPHQSGNPDANQYQPVFNGQAAWQLYYGESYSAPTRYDNNQWTRVRIVVSGNRAEIYIKDTETPALVVRELKRETREGRVGLTVGNFAPAYFSNFNVTAMSDPPPLKGKAGEAAAPAPAGTVKSWMVSDAFDRKILEGKYQLAPADREKLNWRKLGVEQNGTANLARLQGAADGRDTVFARLVIQSDREQVKKIRFGFSDEVKVYFNDQLLYGGTDVYQSRDYRFLGTIGLFDELYLPLRRGENELWLAVTENFGGWGVTAQFENMEGIKVNE
ncbi:MAG TPA: family 16 glycoside hydrolase [Pyrinomonadaceae bacterium]|nr:family 16 glycoside hydrolase [Pyrinomonadaceae bacterium]